MLHRAASESDEARTCPDDGRFRPAPFSTRRNLNALPCRVRAVSGECLGRNNAFEYIMDDEKLIECVKKVPNSL